MTIRRKLTGVLLFIALLPVIGLMGVEYGIETGQLVESEGLAHADAAVGTLDKLDRLLFERYRNLLSWAGLEVMEDILVDDIDKRIADTLRGLRTEYGVYSTLYCLDADGNVVADGSGLPRTGNGSHEVRSWVIAHAAMGGQGFELIDYAPVPEVYVGCGFAEWKAVA